MKILVIGGAGFIGSHLVTALLKQNEEVISVDNFDSFYPRSIKESNIKEHFHSKQFLFIEEDILNADTIYEKIKEKKIDLIIHLAAKAGVRPSIENPVEYHKVNAEGTLRMLELARKLDVKKFIFASSSSVYGENPNIPWKESDLDLRPISPYASSKISAENIGNRFSHLYGINFIALRFFTVYGPGQRPDLAIHKFFKNIIEEKAIPVYGDGNTSRDYTYIDDIISGVIGALNLPVKPSFFDIYNLGNSKTINLSELISLIEKVIGKKAIIDRKDYQPGDVMITNADISKSVRELGFMPKTGIKKGLEEFYSWYKKYSLCLVFLSFFIKTST